MRRPQKIRNCYECGGSGTCIECNNSGKCEVCEGNGRCYECDGDGDCPKCAECEVCGGDDICPECHESGKCIECEGSGLCPECEGKNPDCVECGGSGNCVDCDGSGVCDTCDGDGDCPRCSDCPVCGGNDVCPECRGSGKCIECEGFGHCPNCEGERECPECDGTGRIISELVSFHDVLRYTLPLQKDGLREKFDIHVSLGYFKSYLDTFEDFLVDKAVDVRAYLEDDEFFVNIDKTAFETYLDNLTLKQYFPNLFRQTFFVATFSLIEAELKDICKRFRDLDKPTLSNEESIQPEHNGNDKNSLTKLRGCIVKEAKIIFPDSRQWQAIHNCRRLRNCIIHHQGRFDATPKKLKQYISHQPNLTIESGFIIIHKGFCHEVIETIDTFFNQLEEAIEKGSLIARHNQK